MENKITIDDEQFTLTDYETYIKTLDRFIDIFNLHCIDNQTPTIFQLRKDIIEKFTQECNRLTTANIKTVNAYKGIAIIEMTDVVKNYLNKLFSEFNYGEPVGCLSSGIIFQKGEIISKHINVLGMFEKEINGTKVIIPKGIQAEV